MTGVFLFVYAPKAGVHRHVFHIGALLFGLPCVGKCCGRSLYQIIFGFEVISFNIIEISTETFEFPFIGNTGFDVNLHNWFELNLKIKPIDGVDYNEEC